MKAWFTVAVMGLLLWSGDAPATAQADSINYKDGVALKKAKARVKPGKKRGGQVKASVPELDPRGATGAAILLMGGVVVLAERRRQPLRAI